MAAVCGPAAQRATDAPAQRRGCDHRAGLRVGTGPAHHQEGESDRRAGQVQAAEQRPAELDQPEQQRWLVHDCATQRQPLLPNRLSQLGPGVAWHDIDGDGNDDLIIGSGKDGRLAVFLNNGKGGFAGLSAMATAAATTRDQTSVLAWTASPGSSSLLAGLSNFEDGKAEGKQRRRMTKAPGKAETLLASTVQGLSQHRN